MHRYANVCCGEVLCKIALFVQSRKAKLEYILYPREMLTSEIFVVWVILRFIFVFYFCSSIVIYFRFSTILMIKGNLYSMTFYHIRSLHVHVRIWHAVLLAKT